MDSQESIFIYLFKVPSCSIKGIYIFYWDLKMRMLWVSLTFAILKEESIFKSAPESYNKSPGLSFFFPFPIAYLQPHPHPHCPQALLYPLKPYFYQTHASNRSQL